MRKTPNTIKSVAAALGVSVATVSRAIARPELVKAKTRARVLAGIERLGYRPNLTARDLRRGESRVVLVVVPKLSAYFLEVMRGAEQAANEIGLTVLMGDSQADPEREQAFFDQVVSRRADGIVLLTGTLPSGVAARLQDLPPLVVAAEYLKTPPLPTVRVDHAGGAEQAVRHLIELGHRRIAHIAGPDHIASARDRALGYTRALHAARLSLDPTLLTHGQFSVVSGQNAMHALMQHKRPPTAVFAANDDMAIGAIRALKRIGVKVPEDVSVVGFDDQPIAEIYDPPLTTVHIPQFDIGYRAMMLLRDIIRGVSAARTQMLEARLIVRGTTAAAKTRRLAAATDS